MSRGQGTGQGLSRWARQGSSRWLLHWGLMPLLVMLLSSCGPSQPPVQRVNATVQRVMSGHTLSVTIPTLDPVSQQSVRLLGIDAPNPKQKPWGEEALNRLQALVDEGQIQLEFDLQPQDSYKRLLAYVWQGDRLLNQALVAQGYALAAPRLPNIRYDERLKRAQETARLSGLGIWNPANPLRQTPTEFRETL